MIIRLLEIEKHKFDSEQEQLQQGVDIGRAHFETLKAAARNSVPSPMLVKIKSQDDKWVFFCSFLVSNLLYFFFIYFIFSFLSSLHLSIF